MKEIVYEKDIVNDLTKIFRKWIPDILSKLYLRELEMKNREDVEPLSKTKLTKELGLKSTGSFNKYIEPLEELGLVEKEWNKLTLTPKGLLLWKLLATPYYEEIIKIIENFIRTRKKIPSPEEVIDELKEDKNNKDLVKMIRLILEGRDVKKIISETTLTFLA